MYHPKKDICDYKSANGQKVSPEFLQALKNTAQLPLKLNKSSKENYAPQQSTMTKATKEHSEKEQPKRVIEDDIAKIAKSYILQGDSLKKHEYVGYGSFIKQKTKEIQKKKNVEQPQFDDDMKMYKEMIKLQYLEKKGFLRPDEKETLNRVRSQKQFGFEPIKHKGKQNNISYQQPKKKPSKQQHYNDQYENINTPFMNDPMQEHIRISSKINQKNKTEYKNEAKYYPNQQFNNERYCRYPDEKINYRQSNHSMNQRQNQYPKEYRMQYSKKEQMRQKQYDQSYDPYYGNYNFRR